MSEKPKRRWFRFHLLTAIVGMVAAGGVLGINMIGAGSDADDWGCLPPLDVISTDSAYGWPERIQRIIYNRDGQVLWAARSERAVLIDAACFVGLIAFSFFACESIIRRSEAHKTPSPP